MDKLVTFRGVQHECYLDDESKRALPESLHEQADWLIHIGRHIPKNSTIPSAEKIEVAKFISKLKLAIRAYSNLAPSNQSRILDFKAKNMLDEILESAKSVDAEPLPKKTELENLYRTFCAIQHPDLGSKKTSGREGNRSLFQTFMGVVIKHVAEVDEDKRIGEKEDVRLERYIERATSQYVVTLKNMEKEHPKK